jgi:flagellar motor switch/type III secretory pathway protein FliN
VLKIGTKSAEAAPAAAPAEKPAPAPAPAAAKPAAPAKPAAASTASKPKPAAAPKPVARPHACSVHDLPLYAKSLLKVEVPVIVTLAQKRQRLSRIMELGPGSIIQFDKSCEEMLDLDVGGRHVACGEAVKIGDKFGLRIQAIVLPDERFVTMTHRNSA